MIILRERLYTKLDNEVIEEFLKSTGNLSHVPDGVKNMSNRDVVRLKRLTDNFNMNSRGNFKLTDSDKEFLTNIGLTKSVKGLEHLVNKYNNPELLKRWAKMKNASLSADQKKQIEALENARQHYEESDSKNPVNELIKNDIMKGFGVDTNKLNSGIDLASKEWANSSKAPNEINVPGSKELYNKLVNSIRDTKEITMVYNDDLKNAYYAGDPNRKDSGLITLGTPGEYDGFDTLGHEYGHHRTNKKQGGIRGRQADMIKQGIFEFTGEIKDGNPVCKYYPAKETIDDLSNECSASSSGLAQLSKLGATPEQIEQAKKNYRGVYNTYLNHAVKANLVNIKNNLFDNLINTKNNGKK